MRKWIFGNCLFFSLLVTTLAFAESSTITHEHCRSLDKEVFNHNTTLACPLFASYHFGRMDFAGAQEIRKWEKMMRELLLQHQLAADVRIKVGAEVVSPEEVWFIPEVGFFYHKSEDLEKVNQLLQTTPASQIVLTADELVVYGAFQGYLGQLNVQGDMDSLVFMSPLSDEWPAFQGEERLAFFGRQLELILALKQANHLVTWQKLLTENLPKDHVLDWNVIQERSGKKLRLSTYFDYQWYSGRLPDNNTLASELIEDFEVDFFHPGQLTD